MLRKASIVSAALVMAWPVVAQAIDSSQLPANGNYQTVGKDATGAPVVETTDPSIMTFGEHPYGWHANGVFGSTTAVAAAPQKDQDYNLSADGTMDKSNAAPPVGPDGEVPGMTPSQSAEAAWAADQGCAVALCMGGANQHTGAAECSIILDKLAALQKLGQQPAACKDTSYTYTPPTCASGWTLYDRGGWQNWACRAVLQLPPPPPDHSFECAQNVALLVWNGLSVNGGAPGWEGMENYTMFPGNNGVGGYCYVYFNPAYWYVQGSVTARIFECHPNGSVAEVCAGYPPPPDPGGASTNGGTGGAGGD